MVSSVSLIVSILLLSLARAKTRWLSVWQAFSAEEKQGKDLVDAAKKAGIKHFVWTTLEHSDIAVPHFETKANIDDYLKESGVPRTSYVLLESMRTVPITYFCE